MLDPTTTELPKRPPHSGRVKVNWDPRTIEELAATFASEDDIAVSIGTEPDVFHRRLNRDVRVRNAFRRGRAKGRIALAIELRKKVRDGNVTAMIFLAKQPDVLGWIDEYTKAKINVNTTGPVTLSNVNQFSDAELEKLLAQKEQKKLGNRKAKAKELAQQDASLVSTEDTQGGKERGDYRGDRIEGSCLNPQRSSLSLDPSDEDEDLGIKDLTVEAVQ